MIDVPGLDEQFEVYEQDERWLVRVSCPLFDQERELQHCVRSGCYWADCTEHQAGRASVGIADHEYDDLVALVVADLDVRARRRRAVQLGARLEDLGEPAIDLTELAP